MNEDYGKSPPEKKLSELPEIYKEAISWLVGRRDAVEMLCKNVFLTREKRNKLTREAIRKNDYRLLGMVLVERIIHRD